MTSAQPIFLALAIGASCSENGIYPHRTKSFISTISRCVQSVAEWETTQGHERFDAVIVTRLDVISGVTLVGSLASWWGRALASDIVGAKKSTGALVFCVCVFAHCCVSLVIVHRLSGLASV